MSTAPDQIGALMAAYRAAVIAKDVDAFVRLYADDVRIFDAWGIWSYDGTDQWRKAVVAWFASLGTESVRVTFDEVRQTIGATLSCASAIVTYTAVSASGEPLRAMQNRLTWFMHAHDSALRIGHEHTSAPIGFDDMKALLKREPA